MLALCFFAFPFRSVFHNRSFSVFGYREAFSSFLFVSCWRLDFFYNFVAFFIDRADATEPGTHRTATDLASTNVGALRSPAFWSRFAPPSPVKQSPLERFALFYWPVYWCTETIDFSCALNLLLPILSVRSEQSGCSLCAAMFWFRLRVESFLLLSCVLDNAYDTIFQSINVAISHVLTVSRIFFNVMGLRRPEELYRDVNKEALKKLFSKLGYLLPITFRWSK